MKLFVAGLPYDLDDAELTEIFEKFGTIASAKVAIDRETGKSKGFGFVDMPNSEEARDAIENLKDISLGKKVIVKLVRIQSIRSWRGEKIEELLGISTDPIGGDCGIRKG